MIYNNGELNKEINKQKLLCQRCSHEWAYRGNNPYFTLCPYCRTTVRIRRKKKPLQSLEVRGPEKTVLVTPEGEVLP